MTAPTRDPRTDPREGDEIRLSKGTILEVVMVLPSGLAVQASDSSKLLLSTIDLWREIAARSEVIRYGE